MAAAHEKVTSKIQSDGRSPLGPFIAEFGRAIDEITQVSPPPVVLCAVVVTSPSLVAQVQFHTQSGVGVVVDFRALLEPSVLFPGLNRA